MKKQEMVDYCEKIGGQIGLYCADTGQKGLLYDLRRCKRYDKFLETLERIKHRVDGYTIHIGGKEIPLHIGDLTVEEGGSMKKVATLKDFFDYLTTFKTEWREYRALIDIFAKDKEYSASFAKQKSIEIKS